MEFQCHKVSANELNIRDIKFITIMFTLVFGWTYALTLQPELRSINTNEMTKCKF